MYSSVRASASAAARLEQPAGGRRDPRRRPGRAAYTFGIRSSACIHPVTQRFGVDTELVQQRVDDAFGVGEQREQHVLRLDRLVVARHGLLVCALAARSATSSSACSCPSGLHILVRRSSVIA